MPALAVAPRPLTVRQREVLDFLYAYTLQHGYQPTAREVLARFRLSSLNSYGGHLRALDRKGYLRVAFGRSRGVKFLLWPDGEPFTGLARPSLESVTPESP
jgi:SOS-response transcriptional repressor LexA